MIERMYALSSTSALKKLQQASGHSRTSLGTAGFLHTVRSDEQKAVVICQVAHLEIAVLVLTAGSVTV